MTIPGKVVELAEGIAKVDFSSHFVDAKTDVVRPKIGDYVFVAKGFVISVVPKDKAERILRDFNEIGE